MGAEYPPVEESFWMIWAVRNLIKERLPYTFGGMELLLIRIKTCTRLKSPCRAKRQGDLEIISQ